jgi:hypothetical protein
MIVNVSKLIEFELITSNEDYLNVQDQMRMHFELINQMNLKLNQIIANNPDFKLSVPRIHED